MLITLHYVSYPPNFFTLGANSTNLEICSDAIQGSISLRHSKSNKNVTKGCCYFETLVVLLKIKIFKFRC